MKKIFCFLLSLILCLTVFSGCGEETPAPSSSQASSSDTSSVTDTPDEPEVDETLYNPLTGKYELESAATTLPVALMICNDHYTNSQPGFHTADMYVETETEGGISRVMAVYADASRVPELAGPVRSGRTPFIQISRALGFVYIHAGGSPKALQMVKEKGVHNINALGSGIATVRDSQMRSANAGKYDHCLGVTGEAVVKAMNKAGFDTAYENKVGWGFSETVPGTAAANSIEIKMSAHKTGNSVFEYNAQTNTYLKYRGTESNKKAHTSTSGEQLEVANIVILFADKYVEQVETYTRINFKLDEGSKALVFSGGKIRDVNYTYTKTGMTLKETDGSTATLLPGKTYFYIMSSKYTDQVKISA